MLERSSVLLIYRITVLTIYRFLKQCLSVATELLFSQQDATGKLELEICMPVTGKHTSVQEKQLLVCEFHHSTWQRPICKFKMEPIFPCVLHNSLLCLACFKNAKGIPSLRPWLLVIIFRLVEKERIQP